MEAVQLQAQQWQQHRRRATAAVIARVSTGLRLKNAKDWKILGDWENDTDASLVPKELGLAALGQVHHAQPG